MRPSAAVPLLVLAGVLAGAALVELGLRFAEPRPAGDLRGLHQAEPGTPWLYRLRPGAELSLERTGGVRYRVNEDGFRGRPYTKERRAGAFRVAVLGDSVTFGFGVAEDDVYTARLEAQLAEILPGRALEVLNQGVGGYNAYNEAALYEGIAAAWQPDLVLVQFCINDLNDPRLHFDAQTQLALDALPDAAFPDPRVRAQPVRAPTPLAACSARLRLCERLERALFGDGAGGAAFLRSIAPKSALEDPERAWLGAQYTRLARAAAAQGARFAVVVFPYPQQLADASSDGIARDLAALGREDGFDTIDLLPAFRAAAASGGEPLFLDLWHPTARGHAVAAQALAQALLEQDLVPRAAD